MDTNAIEIFLTKKLKNITIKIRKIFKGLSDVNELIGLKIKVNDDLQVTLIPAVHWSKRSLFDTNKTFWGSFLIEYKDKKILFACDTGEGKIYKELGNKFGPIDLTLINIGAYNFFPMMPERDKSVYHTNPEQALSISRDLKSKNLGMHWALLFFLLSQSWIRLKDSKIMQTNLVIKRKMRLYLASAR